MDKEILSNHRSDWFYNTESRNSRNEVILA